MSPLAYRLFQYLLSRPANADLPMEELVAECHSSKTAVRAAMEELSTNGLLTYVQES